MASHALREGRQCTSVLLEGGDPESSHLAASILIACVTGELLAWLALQMAFHVCDRHRRKAPSRWRWFHHRPQCATPQGQSQIFATGDGMLSCSPQQPPGLQDKPRPFTVRSGLDLRSAH